MADFRRGGFESAIDNWTRAEELFRKQGASEAQCRVMIELSQAYQAVGQSNRALGILEASLTLAGKMEDPYHGALVLNHLGNLHTLMGDSASAQTCLRRSLQIAQTLGKKDLAASVLNHQGNLFLFRKNYPGALKAYADSIELSRSLNNVLLTITAQINLARAGMAVHSMEQTRDLLENVLEKLLTLEDSSLKANNLMNIGLAWQDLGYHFPQLENGYRLRCYDLFTRALGIALNLGDYRAVSYALGYTGNLYETEGRYREALALTQRAVFFVQQVYAPESLYKWQWQSGRIHKQMGRISEAVAAYRRTLFSLQSIRLEIDNCHDIRQVSFRNIAGSVCFELVDLLLEQSRFEKDSQKLAGLLLEVRDVVELLRVYELRNYFKDDCVDAASFPMVSLDAVSRTAVVIYPILLESRMELLVSLPSGLKQVTVPVDRKTITREIRAFRKKLEKRTTWEFLPHSQKIYDYLIRPLEPDLSSAAVDTLVFVPSGPLRTVPMAALQDGSRFLIQKYAVAVTPGLNLIDPTPIQRNNLKILAAGISQAAHGFPPLPEVASELQGIQKLFSSKLLLDQDFSILNMENELKKEAFNIVHIASHGQFQGDVNHTFILAFDGKLTLDTLDKYAGFLQFRKTPLDLLTLSACESAAGDDLAALGMAGIAVKAGARSALATLWFIDDMASSLVIKKFYSQLKYSSVSRAAALREAQLSLLDDPKYGHPGYWSPFLLINNWL